MKLFSFLFNSGMEKKSKKNTITLEPPPDNSSFESYFYGLSISGASIKGDRDSNEDVEVLNTLTTPDPSPLLMVGLLDGHGGYEAAVYCSNEIIKSFAENMKIWPNIHRIFTHSFKNTHKHFARYFPRSEAGTTATFALIQQNSIHVANCGDSRAVVLYHDAVQQITIDHSPGNPEEKARIAAMGGVVTNIGGVSRVFGILSVSRALGDNLLKPYVSELPDVFELEASREVLAVILGCDGLFYGLSNEEISTKLREELRAGYSLKEAAQRLSQISVDRHCYDNVSLVAIVFPGGIEALIEGKAREIDAFVDENEQRSFYRKFRNE